MTDREAPREAPPEERLRAFVRAHAPGGCLALSQGDGCVCPLCDIDRLRRAALPAPSEALSVPIARREVWDSALGALEANIIEQTGNGEFAGYVVRWIEQCRNVPAPHCLTAEDVPGQPHRGAAPAVERFTALRLDNAERVVLACRDVLYDLLTENAHILVGGVAFAEDSLTRLASPPEGAT